MISVEEAKKLIRDHASELPSTKTALGNAWGRILSADVYAAVDIPNFPQSSMDGYAFNYSDWKQNGDLSISGEMAAGSNIETVLKPGSAVRIFTGAAVPDGADTVVMQEKTIVQGGILQIMDKELKLGENVRLKGSEVSSGSLALQKGQRVSPPAIGFLAGFGITELDVYRDPVVTIIVTGNELQEPGKPLRYGQVYESNSFALSSALKEAGIGGVEVYQAGDEIDELTGALSGCMETSDMVLLTGGVSVGDYDFTLTAAANCGIETIFHKIKQKPGKPIFFGTKGKQIVFGLPGNPASVLTCFYEYVTIALEKMNYRRATMQKVMLPLAAAYKKPAGLTHFLKGFQDGHTVTVLDAQESYRLYSFARANCLVVIGEETTFCQEGEQVQVHILP
jgi:molybdopterin molybdotransferase